MKTINIFFMLFFCFCDITAETAKRYNVITYGLTIGVYSPADDDVPWSQLVNQAWNDRSNGVVSSPASLKLLKYSERYQFNLQTITQLKEDFLASPVFVIIGPYNDVLRMVTEELGMLYIVTTWPPLSDVTPPQHTFYLHPRRAALRSAAVDVIREYGWRKVGVIFMGDPASIHEGIKLTADLISDDFHVYPVQAQTASDDELRQKLIDSRLSLVTNFAVIVELATQLESLLQMALSIGMLSDRYSWIALTLNPCLIDWKPYMNTGVNLTVLEFIDPMMLTHPSRSQTSRCPIKDTVSVAMATDSLNVAISAVNSFIAHANKSGPCFLACSHTIKGHELFPFVQQAEIAGLSGRVRLGERNERDTISLRVLSLTSQHLLQVGEWTHSMISNFNYKHLRMNYKMFQNLHSRAKNVQKIAIVLEKPYMQVRSREQGQYEGKERYEGYLADVIEELARRLAFTYELYEPAEATNIRDKFTSGKPFSSLVHELINGNASMALGVPLTASDERLIDYTPVVLERTLSIATRKPSSWNATIQHLWIVWPFSGMTWALLAGTTLAIATIIFLFDQVVPQRRQQGANYTFSDGLLFAMGALFWSMPSAGRSLWPGTFSGKLLGTAWKLCAAFLVYCYIARLTAFFFSDNYSPNFDLSDTKSTARIYHGTVTNSYVIDVLAKMSENELGLLGKVGLTDSAMVESVSEGLTRLKQAGSSESYAFVWDTAALEQQVNRQCDVILTTVQATSVACSLAIGLPQDSPLRDSLSAAILQLREEGFFRRIASRWWSPGSQTTCVGRRYPLVVSSLSVINVFVVIAAATALATCCALVEFVWNKLRIKKLPHQPQTEMRMIEENYHGYTGNYDTNGRPRSAVYMGGGGNRVDGCVLCNKESNC